MTITLYERNHYYYAKGSISKDLLAHINYGEESFYETNLLYIKTIAEAHGWKIKVEDE